MGWIKKIERSSKNGLMRLLTRMLKAPRLDERYFRERNFDRILVIRQHNQMGDMLLAVPAFRALRAKFPDAIIGVVSSTLNRGVLQNNPYINGLFLYDKKNALSLISLVRRLRGEKFDLVIVLHTVSFSFTSIVLAVLSGASLRIGSTSEKVGDSLNGSFLSLTLPLPDGRELAEMSESEHNLYPLRAIGVDTSDLSPLIVPSPENDRWAESFDSHHWNPDCVRLAVHPGAGKAENIWPPQNHAEVVNALARRQAVSVIVVQGPRDEQSVQEFLDRCQSPVTLAAGRGIGEVAALLRRADLVICNDTGVMHVAAAAGATTLAVFGPTDPHRWAPRTNNLHIVRAPGGILGALPPEDVAARAEEILGKRDSRTESRDSSIAD
jgi:heptosyltransferase-2